MEGDDVEIICARSKFKDTNETLSLVRVLGEANQTLVSSDSTKESETRWSKRISMEIKSIQKLSTGTYKCTTGGGDPIEVVKHLEVLGNVH